MLSENAQSAPPEQLAEAPGSFLACLPWLWTRVLFPAETPQPGTPRGLSLLILLVLPAAVLYPCLSFYLFEPDEGRYAQIPFEMLSRGDWVVPYLQGEPYLDKPPLFYWLVMVSYRIFGVHDWAARLVPALAVHGTILLVYLFGCRRLGERLAFWGALTLALTPGFLAMSRLLVLDGLLTFLVTLALFSLWNVARPVQGRNLQSPGRALPAVTANAPDPRFANRGLCLSLFPAPWSLLAAVACGLGILCKGPVILLLTIPPVWLHGWLTRSGARPAWRTVLAFVGVTLAIPLPWYVAICLRSPDFARHFLWQHNVLRFVQPFDHIQPVWYYVPILLPCLLPAALLFLPLVRGMLNGDADAAQRRPPELGFLLLAGGWCVLFFSLSGSKLPTYILPAFPPLALALGAYLALCGWEKSRWTRATAGATLALIVIGHFVLLPWYAASRSPLRHAEQLHDFCRDRTVPVVCHPRSLDSVAFYLGRSDLPSFRGKEVQQLIQFCAQHPRTVVLFSHCHSQESLRQLLPPHLKMTRTAPLGLCSMAVVETGE